MKRDFLRRRALYAILLVLLLTLAAQAQVASRVNAKPKPTPTPAPLTPIPHWEVREHKSLKPGYTVTFSGAESDGTLKVSLNAPSGNKVTAYAFASDGSQVWTSMSDYACPLGFYQYPMFGYQGDPQRWTRLSSTKDKTATILEVYMLPMTFEERGPYLYGCSTKTANTEITSKALAKLVLVRSSSETPAPPRRTSVLERAVKAVFK